MIVNRDLRLKRKRQAHLREHRSRTQSPQLLITLYIDKHSEDDICDIRCIVIKIPATTEYRWLGYKEKAIRAQSGKGR